MSLIPVLNLNGMKLKELPPNKNGKVYFEIDSNTVEVNGKLHKIYVSTVYEQNLRRDVIRLGPPLESAPAKTVAAPKTLKTADVKKAAPDVGDRMDRLESLVMGLVQSLTPAK